MLHLFGIRVARGQTAGRAWEKMNSSLENDSPDSSGSQLAAVLAVAVVPEIGHMQVGTVQKQAQPWGRVFVVCLSELAGQWYCWPQLVCLLLCLRLQVHA